ncbi:unnamed protein product [Prorocentrum cordatum]|uniref:Uncharacterized protein n=3 Tax=Prorocentrum cordatum TaxID=2364126 RepID=A0ABN9PVI1_9DINO|nr:unnamed protein product [Polarella glacialis]
MRAPFRNPPFPNPPFRSARHAAVAGWDRGHVRPRAVQGGVPGGGVGHMRISSCEPPGKSEMKMVVGGPDCSQLCAEQREPRLDWDRIRASYDECKGGCLPQIDQLVRAVYLSGSTAVLGSLGAVLLLTRCCSCDDFVGVFGLDLDLLVPRAVHAGPDGGGCACLHLYAILFYALSLALFLRATLQDMADEVGVNWCARCPPWRASASRASRSSGAWCGGSTCPWPSWPG